MGSSGSTLSSNLKGKSVPKCDLDPFVLSLISPKVDQLPDELSFETIKTALAKKVDVFFTHNWSPTDAFLPKVTEINTALKAQGFMTSCDHDKLEASVQNKMADGVDHSSCVVVFITQQYIEKVVGVKQANGCQQEFKYAAIRKTNVKMIPVVLEASVLDPSTWKGEAGKTFGGVTPVDLSGPVTEAKLNELHDRIMVIIKIQIQKAIEDCFRATAPRTTVDRYHLFLSYRAATDVKHAERLYEMLTAAGLKVWWDKKNGATADLKKDLCPGLKNCSACLCIISSAGTDQPFQKLGKDSALDSVYLEHRLALELKQKEYLHHVFPIMIGNEIKESAKTDGDRFGQYRSSFQEAKVCVTSVEDAVKRSLTELGLGAPLSANPTVYDVANMMRSCNGYFIGGAPTQSFNNAVRGIVGTLLRPVSLEDYESALRLNEKLTQERDAMKLERDNMMQENNVLQLKNKNLDTNLVSLADRIESTHKKCASVAVQISGKTPVK